MDFKDLRSDKELASGGVWLAMEPGDETEFLLRSTDSEEYKRALSRHYDRFQRTTRRRRPSMDTDRKQLIEVLVDAVLIDWKNVKLDGRDIPYSKDAARQLLGDFNEFYVWVVNESDRLSNFQAEAEEQDLGN